MIARLHGNNVLAGIILFGRHYLVWQALSCLAGLVKMYLIAESHLNPGNSFNFTFLEKNKHITYLNLSLPGPIIARLHDNNVLAGIIFFGRPCKDVIAESHLNSGSHFNFTFIEKFKHKTYLSLPGPMIARLHGNNVLAGIISFGRPCKGVIPESHLNSGSCFNFTFTEKNKHITYLYLSLPGPMIARLHRNNVLAGIISFG